MPSSKPSSAAVKQFFESERSGEDLYEISHRIGKGSYGTVRLVKLNSSGKHYALKGMLIEQVRKQAHFLNMIYVE